MEATARWRLDEVRRWAQHGLQFLRLQTGVGMDYELTDADGRLRRHASHRPGD